MILRERETERETERDREPASAEQAWSQFGAADFVKYGRRGAEQAWSGEQARSSRGAWEMKEKGDPLGVFGSEGTERRGSVQGQEEALVNN